jgi:hypothetical protein
MRTVTGLLILVVATATIAQPPTKPLLNEVDELAGFRESAMVESNCDAILSGSFESSKADRVTIYAVTTKREACTRGTVVFESKAAGEINTLIELLKVVEDYDDKLTIETSGHKDLIIAFFQADKPIAWFLVRRGYDQISVYRESLFPDGNWVITGGRTFNQFEAWLMKRKLVFPKRAK